MTTRRRRPHRQNRPQNDGQGVPRLRSADAVRRAPLSQGRERQVACRSSALSENRYIGPAPTGRTDGRPLHGVPRMPPQVIDRGRSDDQVRGVVCKRCRTRLSVADGSSGNLMALFAQWCRCRSGMREWDVRSSLATNDYRQRAADIAATTKGLRTQFAELVRRVETEGLDPLAAWSDR
jgi:hypothetical protein